MAAGVSIQFPETVVIDPEVTVGADTLFESDVQLLGRTRIGANCVIRTGSIISDCMLGDGVIVKPYSILNASRVAAGAQVGPFAHLREAAELRENSRVGNFVEVKKSVIGKGVKAMHLSYLGDAKIGDETNIGAGTITCNYDGVNKNPTTIGRRVFIGSDTRAGCARARWRRRVRRRGIGSDGKRAAGRVWPSRRGKTSEQTGMGQRSPPRRGRARPNSAARTKEAFEEGQAVAQEISATQA